MTTKHTLEERLAELEHDINSIYNQMHDMLQRQSWSDLARLAEGLARCAHLRAALDQFITKVTT